MLDARIVSLSSRQMALFHLTINRPTPFNKHVVHADCVQAVADLAFHKKENAASFICDR
jgi:hypothetical protein